MLVFSQYHIPDVQPNHEVFAKIIRASERYKINPKDLLYTAVCESGLNPKAYNPKDPNGGSKGIFQYQEKTFYPAAKELNIENPDIWNPEQQIELTAYLFSQKKSYLWTCAPKHDISYTK